MLLQERGEIDASIDPDRAATWILAAWDGLQSHWLVEPSFDTDVELGLLIDTILGRTRPGAERMPRSRAPRTTAG